jgi:hypothetical protein
MADKAEEGRKRKYKKLPLGSRNSPSGVERTGRLFVGVARGDGRMPPLTKSGGARSWELEGMRNDDCSGFSEGVPECCHGWLAGWLAGGMQNGKWRTENGERSIGRNGDKHSCFWPDRRSALPSLQVTLKDFLACLLACLLAGLRSTRIAGCDSALGEVYLSWLLRTAGC